VKWISPAWIAVNPSSSHPDGRVLNDEASGYMAMCPYHSGNGFEDWLCLKQDESLPVGRAHPQLEILHRSIDEGVLSLPDLIRLSPGLSFSGEWMMIISPHA